jgi:hypothetical protein
VNTDTLLKNYFHYSLQAIDLPLVLLLQKQSQAVGQLKRFPRTASGQFLTQSTRYIDQIK